MNGWRLGQSFQSSGGKVAYEVFGDGPPLVLVHGTPFSSYVWRNIIPELTKHWPVHVYDLLGYGTSEKRTGQDVSLAMQTRVMVELLGHWRLEAPAIAGHDFGDTTILRTHLLEGRQFSSITLMDAVALAPWGSPFVQHVKKHEEAFQGIPGYIHRAIVAAYVRDAIHRMMTDEEILPYIEPWLGPEGQNAFYRQIAQMDERYTTEVEPYYGRIDRPVLLLWGAKDRWVPPSKGNQLHGMIRTSEFRLIPNASHLMSNPTHLLLQRDLRLVRGPTMRLAWVRGPPFDAGVTLGAGREVQRSGKRGPPWSETFISQRGRS